MVRSSPGAQAGAMTSTPHDAPPAGGPTPPPGDDGPRVTRDQVRDLTRLRRSASDRKVAGVAGGLARHLDVDPVIIRIAFVVLTLFGGGGLIVYGALWLVLPEDGQPRGRVSLDDRNRSLAVIAIGVVAALSLFGDPWGGGWGFPWPVAALGIVALLVVNGRQRDHRQQGVQGPTPGDTQVSLTKDRAPSGTGTGTGTGGSYAEPRYVVPPPPRNPRRRGPILFWFTLALIALALGVLGMTDVAGAHVALGAYPAVALAAIGVMLLVGSVYGRAGGLILLGVLTLPALGLATAADHWQNDGLVVAPTTAADVTSSYWRPAGDVVVDLSGVSDVWALGGRTLDLGVGIGTVKVILPEGMDVTVTGDVGGPGDISLLGRHSSGVGISDTGYSDFAGDAPDLRIEVFAGVGEIEVTRR